MSIRENKDIRFKDLCFIDTETTGSVFGFHEIIDIGAIRTSSESVEIIGIWQRKVKPRFPSRITESAQKLNGFTPQDWDDSVNDSRELWHEFNQFVAGSVPVCHNPSFDRAFITLAATARGVDKLTLDYHWIGTESLAWPLYKQGKLNGLHLRDICGAFGIDEEPTPHCALEGARTCMRVYKALLAK